MRRILVAVALLLTATPATAADRVSRSNLPERGRIEVVLPATGTFGVDFSMGIWSDGFLAFVVHGRPTPKHPAQVIGVGFEEGADAEVSVGGSGPPCPPPVSCRVSRDVGELTAGFRGKAVAGTRIVLVWAGPSARVSAWAAGVRLTGPDNRYARSSAPTRVTAQTSTASVSAGEESVSGVGTVAVAVLPCGPPWLATATLWRGTTKVADLDCTDNPDHVAALRAGSSATWTLRGTFTGTGPGPTIFLTIAVG